MFNWVFNQFYFLSRVLHQSRDFPGVTSVWGVSAVAILYSSVNCVRVWSTKKLTMPAYCVAAICNNSQMTPGITMHELPIKPQWGESGLNLYNLNELTFLLRRITPICVASTSVIAISQTPWNTAWGLLRSWHDVPVLFQNPAWQVQTDTAVSLLGLSGKVSVSSSELELAILQRLPRVT